MYVKKTKEQKHPKVIEEPRPGPNHLICALCREQFKDYLEHVQSTKHREVGVVNNIGMFKMIDEVITQIYEICLTKQKKEEKSNKMEEVKIQLEKTIILSEKKEQCTIETVDNHPESTTLDTDDDVVKNQSLKQL